MGRFAWWAVWMAAACGSVDEGPPTLEVAIAEPADVVHTNATVTVRVVVTGDPPESVHLLRDDEPLATLDPDWTFEWDTRAETEGEHTLVARATVGETAFVSDPRTVFVDRTPPAVVSRSPEDGETDVSVHEPVVAGFGESLDPATAGASASLEVAGVGPLAVDVDLSADGRTLTLVADPAPTAPAELTVRVEGATDLAGNVGPTAEWSFAAPVWLALGEVGDGDPPRPARTPSLAVGPDGDLALAWAEETDGSFDVQVARWDGTSWRRVGGPLGGLAGATDVQTPRLALTGSGDPVLAWDEDEGGTGHLFTAAWDGADWVLLGELDAAAGDSWSASAPSVAVGPGDEFVVAWHEWDGGSLDVYVRRWDGEGWEDLGQPNDEVGTGLDALYPTLAVDAPGRVVSAWVTNLAGAPRDVWVGSREDSGWLSEGQIPAPDTSDRPALALDAEDRPVVVWREEQGATAVVALARRIGAAWSEPTTFTVSGAPMLIGTPSLAIGSDDVPVVAWLEGDPLDVHVYRVEGGEWTRVGEPLSVVPGATSAASASLVIGADDVPVVAFDEVDLGGSTRVFVRRLNR